MEKENKKQQHIDEELMMSLMVDGVRKEGIKEPSPSDIEKVEDQNKAEDTPLKKKSISKQKKQTKQSVETDYETIFFKKSDTNARDGKTVYIRPEFHEKLTRIIHIMVRTK